MLTGISHHSVYVLDQDEALDFYCGKLGFEVADDVDLGFMRWLTIELPTDRGRQIMLEVPGPPFADDATAAQLRDLVTKGALGAAAILSTEDCRATYAELRAKGVEFTDEPTEQPYGHRLRAAGSLRQPRPHHPAGRRPRRGLRGGQAALAGVMGAVRP